MFKSVLEYEFSYVLNALLVLQNKFVCCTKTRGWIHENLLKKILKINFKKFVRMFLNAILEKMLRSSQIFS